MIRCFYRILPLFMFIRLVKWVEPEIFYIDGDLYYRPYKGVFIKKDK